MLDGWRVATLGEITSPVRRQEIAKPGGSYPLLGVRWYGSGPFHRETVSGIRLKAQRYSRVATGDLIYNRLFAWKGSFGVIDPSLDGMYVSGEFPTFVVDPQSVTPEFLSLTLCRPTVWDQIERESTGSTATSRNRWLEDRFNEFPILLPPLAEQRRIVDLIGAVDVTIESASTVERRASALWHSWAEDVWATADDEVQLGAIGRAITGSTPSTARPEYWYPQEVPFFGPGDLGEKPVLTESRRYVSRAGADAVRPIPAPAVAQVCVGFGTGKVAVLGVPGCTNQQMNALIGLDEVDAITAMAMLRSAAGQDRLRSITGLTVTPVVRKSAWAAMDIRWPSREARTVLVEVVTDTARVADSARRTAEVLGVLRAALLGQLLDGRHQVPASYDRLLDGVA
jgi:type I restriction enzyme S subunit